MPRGTRITQATADRVLQLFAAGESISAIGRACKISRGSVRRIVNGEWCQATQRKAKRTPSPTHLVRVKKYRCPGCGGLTIFSPCQVCCRQRRPPLPDAPNSLALDLEPDEAERLQEVKDGTWRPVTIEPEPEPEPEPIIPDPRLAELDDAWLRVSLNRR